MDGDEHKKVPMRFVLAEGFGSDGLLCCPSCGCREVHPGCVLVQQGETETFVNRDGTNVVASNRHKKHSGSLIGLSFFCENLCTFDYLFEFHEGSLSVRLTVGSCTDHPSELWRN